MISQTTGQVSINWFVTDKVLDLEKLNPSFWKYEKVIKPNIDELIDQEQSIYNCVY